MKIAMLFGSPHMDGTTNQLAESFIKGAQANGHEVTRLNLGRMKIGPCLACDYCSRNDGVCVQKDDMAKVVEALLDSDMVALVSPLYYFTVSAQLKTVIDRFYAQNSPLRDKRSKAVLLAACAESDSEAMDALREFYKALCKYMRWEDKGMVLALGCWSKEDILKTDYPKLAQELGEKIQ